MLLPVCSARTQIVKEPMDLKTMRQKVQAGEYKNLQEMRNDCELMSKNALLFNRAPGEVRGWPGMAWLGNRCL